MNVFPAALAQEGGQLAFHLDDGLRLTFAEGAFSPDLRARLEGMRDDIAIGVRPHAVRLSQDGLPARVFVNQWLGDQTHIAANFAGATIVSVVHDRAPFQAGDEVGVSIAPEDLQIFDRHSGKAISHGGQLA
jgi:multiple sugar transport system ATP-binding protein